MKKQIISGLLVTGILLVSACGKEATLEDHLADAKKYREAGDLAAAQIEAKNAARMDPQSAGARVELTRLALIAGEWAAAEKEARRAIDLGVTGEIHLQLVTALYGQEAYEGIVEETETLSPDLAAELQADLLAYRALAQIELQQYRSAEAAVDSALELNADSDMARLARARYEFMVGSRETALALATALAEDRPEAALAWRLVAQIHQANGNLEQSRDAYSRAIEILPYLTLDRVNRAYILARLGDSDAAGEDLAKYQGSTYKDHGDVAFVAGFLAFQAGEYGAASEGFGASLASGYSSPTAALYLAASYLQEGKVEQARQVANQLNSAIPNSVEVNRLMASIDMEEQDLDSARQRLLAQLQAQEMAKEAGDETADEGVDVVALGMLGTIALMEGDGDAAVGYFERLVAAAPDDETAQKLLQRAMTMRGDYIGDMSALALQSVSPEEYDQALISAATAYQKGQLKEALTIAENLQQQFPERVGPLNLLATFYLASGQVTIGKGYFEQALALEPMEPSATKGLAQIYLRNGEEQRAFEMMENYLSAHPDDPHAVGIFADAVVSTQEYKESERLLLQLNKKQDNLKVQSLLARLYFENGRYQQVIVLTENLQEDVVRAQPILIELRGKSLARMGEPAEAGKTWERWLEISPDFELPNYYHGIYLEAAREEKKALSYIEKAVEINPNYLPARNALVKTYAKTGDMDKAFSELGRLKKELAEYGLERGEVWFTEGWLQVKAGNYEQAVPALEKSLALAPTPDAVGMLFYTLNTLKRSDEGLAALDQWLDTFPDNEVLLQMAARTHLEGGNNARSIELYERILAINPNSVIALNNLAWLLQDKDIQQAVVYIQQALELEPEDEQVRDTAATLREKGGRF